MTTSSLKLVCLLEAAVPLLPTAPTSAWEVVRWGVSAVRMGNGQPAQARYYPPHKRVAETTKMTTATARSTTSVSVRSETSGIVIQAPKRPKGEAFATSENKPVKTTSGGPVWEKAHHNPRFAMAKMTTVTARSTTYKKAVRSQANKDAVHKVFCFAYRGKRHAKPTRHNRGLQW